MTFRFPQRWKDLGSGTPGRRFRDRYERNRRSPGRRRWLGQLLRLLLAIVCFFIGAVLAVIPGPAVVFFALAGALVAADWLWAARVLDWSELRLRALARRAQRLWRRLPPAGRAVLVVAGATLSAASTYSLYRLLN